MLVAIDGRTLAGRSVRGIGRYVFNLLRCWPAEAEPPVVLYDSAAAEGRRPHLPEGSLARLEGFSMPLSRWRSWTLLAEPWHLRRLAADVFHAPGNLAPLWQPAPTVVTLHDAMLWEQARDLPDRPRWYYDRLQPRAYRKARAIITVSHYSRERLEHCFPFLEGRIRVIYHGIEPRFRPMELTEAAWSALAGYGLRRPFVLVLGGDLERKRVSFAVETFARAHAGRPVEHQLAVAGLRDIGRERLRGQVETLNLTPHVVALPFVADEHMPLLYSAAAAVMYPSAGEGFGFPLLEAMACGAACMTSRATSLPEIAGDGALVLGPDDQAAWVENLRSLLGGGLRWDERRAATLRQAGRFDWEKAVSETFDIYRLVAEGGSL